MGGGVGWGASFDPKPSQVRKKTKRRRRKKEKENLCSDRDLYPQTSDYTYPALNPLG